MGLFTRGLGFFKNKKTFNALEIFTYPLNNNGSPEMNINSLAEPVIFSFKIPSDKNLWLKRITITILNTTIEPDNWFGINLANGITGDVLDENDNIIARFNSGVPIMSMMDLAAFTGSDIGSNLITLGASDDAASLSWNIRENSGEDMFLRAGYTIRLILNDDFEALSLFKTHIHGVIVDKF